MDRYQIRVSTARNNQDAFADDLAQADRRAHDYHGAEARHRLYGLVRADIDLTVMVRPR